MSWNNKVVWSEGMFLRPQHFQQQVRYLEGFIENRCGVLHTHPWGIKELEINKQLLTLGKLAITSAQGVFPDGTPFNIPDDDDPPPVLEILENSHDEVIYLVLPTRRSGGLEVEKQDGGQSLARYAVHEREVRDAVTENGSSPPIHVGKLRTQLLLASDQREEYACIGISRLIEINSDKNIFLDDDFIPTVLNCQGAESLAGFLDELHGLLKHRSEALAARVAVSGRGGAAEIADFLLLQAVNRYLPLTAHLATLQGLHPEDLYSHLVMMAGELATFTNPDKQAPLFSRYEHHDLTGTFRPVIRELRQSLSMVLEQNAIAIPLQERKYGVWVGPMADRKLLLQASFVLAVNASIATEELRKRFPTQIKIGPVEKIRDLVNLALPGIRVRPLPVAPRQIPYQSGFVYFELDRTGEYWKQLQSSGGFAFHIAGEFPDLKIEFWAIKE